MRIKITLAVLGVLAFLLASCEDVASSPPVYGGPGGGRDGGRFYAQDMTNNNFYTLYAEKLWSEEDDPLTRVVVWGEIGSGMTKSHGAQVAAAYNDETDGIYAKLMPVFGMEKPFTDVFTNNPATIAENTMEFADYYGNGDNKLCILLLKIKDGHKPGVNDSYVAGYFTAYNFLAYEPGYYDSYYSNECDMIYLDVKVKKPGSPEINTTLAHEMQHMMNFITTLDRRPSGNTFKQMDLWIDEGLSSAAEYVYSGEHNQERIDWYNNAPLNDITKPGPQISRIAYGNNFYVWGNYTKAIPEAILDDYATVYLFFQWLRLQATVGYDTDIYTEIITSSSSNYNAVLNAAQKKITAYNYNIGGWQSLLRNWMAANYINNNSNHYGYKEEISLTNIVGYGGTAGNYGIDLSPGEGLYLGASGWPNSANPATIKFAGLPLVGASADPSDTGLISSGHLLTYNINTDMEGSPSQAVVPLSPMPKSSMSMAGYKPSLQINASGPGSRNVSGTEGPALLAPYAIGAGDMLMINGQKDDTGIVISKLRTGKRIHE